MSANSQTIIPGSKVYLLKRYTYGHNQAWRLFNLDFPSQWVAVDIFNTLENAQNAGRKRIDHIASCLASSDFVDVNKSEARAGEGWYYCVDAYAPPSPPARLIVAVDVLIVMGMDEGKGKEATVAEDTFSERGLGCKEREMLRWWRAKGWADDEVP